MMGIGAGTQRGQRLQAQFERRIYAEKENKVDATTRVRVTIEKPCVAIAPMGGGFALV